MLSKIGWSSSKDAVQISKKLSEKQIFTRKRIDKLKSRSEFGVVANTFSIVGLVFLKGWNTAEQNKEDWQFKLKEAPNPHKENSKYCPHSDQIKLILNTTMHNL